MLFLSDRFNSSLNQSVVETEKKPDSNDKDILNAQRKLELKAYLNNDEAKASLKAIHATILSLYKNNMDITNPIHSILMSARSTLAKTNNLNDQDHQYAYKSLKLFAPETFQDQALKEAFYYERIAICMSKPNTYRVAIKDVCDMYKIAEDNEIKTLLEKLSVKIGQDLISQKQSVALNIE